MTELEKELTGKVKTLATLFGREKAINAGLNSLCKEWLEKHQVTSYIAEDNGGKYFRCGGFNEADAINLVVEIAKIIEKTRKINETS